MCNRSLLERRLPLSQRHAIVTPIIKKPGLDPEDVTSYRPISNLTYMSKLIERMVCRQVTSFLESTRPSTEASIRFPCTPLDWNCGPQGAVGHSGCGWRRKGDAARAPWHVSSVWYGRPSNLAPPPGKFVWIDRKCTFVADIVLGRQNSAGPSSTACPPSSPR